VNGRSMAETTAKTSRVTAVHGCARCGSDHGAVTFHTFTRPVEAPDGTVWTEFGVCPNRGEPILMRVVDTTPKTRWRRGTGGRAMRGPQKLEPLT